MIIVRLSGGLGNQMFQYAAALALARAHGAQLRFDLEWFDTRQLHQGLELARVFGLELPRATASERWRVLGWVAPPFLRRALSRRSLRLRRLGIEPHFHYWPGFCELPADVFLDGYWQSEKYFAPIADEIRQAFRFAEPLDARNAELFDEMAQRESVALHVRRGDFARDPHVRQVHGVDLNDYFCRAIEEIGARVASPHYHVFSDEPEWVREHLSIPASWTCIDQNRGRESYRDMQLMGLCRHNIIANSSFSWWGAWLNQSPGKIVIAPKKWFVHEVNTTDLIPSEWLVI